MKISYLVKNCNFLDITKFVMAICVVGLHSHGIAHDDFAPFFHYLLLSAVPFFYITSGFLVGRKLGNDNSANIEVCKKSILRYLRIYILWILIYTPISIFVAWMNKMPFWWDAGEYIKGVLFVGEIAYSYPLWYLLGLVVALTIVALLIKLKLRLWVILAISMIFLASGELYKNATPAEGTFWFSVYNIYTELFVSTRNGFFVGFPLVMVGILFSRFMISQSRYGIMFGIGLLFIAWILFVCNIPMWMYVSGGGVFYCSTNIPLGDSTAYKKLRIQSVWIFLVHMYFIFVFAMIDLALPDYSICKSVFLTWFVVGTLTLLTTISLEYLRNKRGWNFLSRLIS